MRQEARMAQRGGRKHTLHDGRTRRAGRGRRAWQAGAALLLAALALQAGARAACAQRQGNPPFFPEADPRRASFSAQYTGSAAAGVLSPGPGENGTLASTLSSARLTVPVARTGTDTLWLAGVSASERTLSFDGFSSALTPALASNLYGATLHGDVLQRLDGDKLLIGFLAVGRYGDQWAPEARGTRTSGGGEVDFRWRAHEILGIGGAVTYILGDRRLLPILRYAYFDSPWFVNVRFPFGGDVRYAVNPWLRVGGRITAEGGEYAIGAPQASVDTVRMSTGLAGVFVALGRRESAQLQIGAGRTFYQRYEALENGTDVETLNFKPSPYYQVTGLLRF